MLLLLLGRNNCDGILREMVLSELQNTIKEDECILYVSQLMHATKWDIHPFNSLMRFLIQKTISNPQFAYVFYWQLQVDFGSTITCSPTSLIQLSTSAFNSI